MSVNRWWWSARAASGAAMLVVLASCGQDLGECNMVALGGSDGTLTPAAPHEGQKVINRSCAGGLCHSASAVAVLRRGAPAGLDFDVVPNVASTPEMATAELVKVQTGYNVVQDHLEAMWAQIDDGHMPPAPPAGSGALSAMDKEAVRNWLACGAPVIATPVPIDAGVDPWTQIYTALSSGTCQACHGPGSTMGSFLPAAGDACAAHASIVGGAASGPACGATFGVLVQPGNPAGSLLLQKLKPTPAPPCGATMPLGQMPLQATDPNLVARIEQWITDGALAPSCP